MPSSSTAENITQVSTSLYAMSSKTKYRSLAWEFLKILCTDESIQQSVFDYSQGASVLKSVMQSRSTEEKLKEDGFGSNSLTVSTIDLILNQGKVKPTFKTYNKVLEEADYLITKSIANNTIEIDLFNIQKTIEDDLKQ